MLARLAVAIFAVLASAATTSAQENSRDKLRQVVYPVADLIVPVEMDMTKPQSGGPATLETTLMHLVRRTCEPKSWSDVGGPGAIRYLPREMKLVVDQSEACHEQIRTLLSELRKLQDDEICIETRYLTLSAARAKQLEAIGDRGKSGKFLPADGPDAVCLSERELLLLLTWAQEDRNTLVQQAPKITMFNAQKCAITAADQVGVKAGDVDQDGAALTTAKVEVGYRNVLQAILEPEHRSLRLAVECRLTTQHETKAGNRVFATKQVKHVVRVPQGQTVALKLSDGAKGAYQYVLLTSRVVCQSEQEVGKQATDERPVQARRPRQEPCLRVFPVADLLEPLVAGPAAGPLKSGPSGSPAAPKVAVPVTDRTLIDLITSTVASKTWEGKGGDGAIHYYPLGQALVVVHQPEVQDEVSNLLAGLRRLYDLRVSFDCRIVEMSEAAAERIALRKSRGTDAARSAPRFEASEEQDRTGPAPAHPRTPSATPASPSLLPQGKSMLTLNLREAQELRHLLAEENSGVVEQVLGAVTFSGSSVRIDKTKPYTYTTDVHVAIQDGRVVVKPVTRTVRVGTIIEALPVAKADREGLLLEISVEHAVLAPTHSTQTVRVGPQGKETEHILQTPSVQTMRMKAVAVLGNTGTLVLPLGAVMSEARTEFGPPVLSRVPYVNRLFRNVGYGREARHLYVVITPEIHAR